MCVLDWYCYYVHANHKREWRTRQSQERIEGMPGSGIVGTLVEGMADSTRSLVLATGCTGCTLAANFHHYCLASLAQDSTGFKY